MKFRYSKHRKISLHSALLTRRIYHPFENHLLKMLETLLSNFKLEKLLEHLTLLGQALSFYLSSIIISTCSASSVYNEKVTFHDFAAAS